MTDNVRCDYSKVTIPNDSAYISVVRAYVLQVADNFGFDESDKVLIGKSIAEAVENVIEHAYERTEQATLEVSCERVPLGLKIAIRDHGTPFDPAPLITEDVCSVNGDTETSGLCLMNEYMDEMEFHNLGKAGKEITLVKYAKNPSIKDFCRPSELESYPPITLKRLEPVKPISFRVAQLKPDQAVEVCKILYKVYGYSYFYTHMYYPDRIVQLNESGHLFSAVAVTEDGEVAGHGALMKTDPQASVAEMGIGAVKPEYRSMGVLSRIAHFLTRKATNDGLLGVFGQAVTNHTFTQQMGLRIGYNDCALLLAYVPITSSFKYITDKLSQRDSMVIHYRYFNKPTMTKVFLPNHHKDFLLDIYANLGLTTELEAGECKLKSMPNQEGVVSTLVTNVQGVAKIHVETYGNNTITEVKTRLKDLCKEKFEVIYLYLDLGDPLTCLFTESFEQMGFFFAGLLPGGVGNDALILQYLNNVPIDYSKIHTKSDMAKRLVEYVMELDPNR
jgi:anti-sigma regulatory factor (Ser/Thr protein kinase)